MYTKIVNFSCFHFLIILYLCCQLSVYWQVRWLNSFLLWVKLSACEHWLLLLFCWCLAVIATLQDKNIATIVEMGFTVQQATAALQHSGGSLDVALNSLLPSDHQAPPADGPPARESRLHASSAVSNGPTHRNDQADTRSSHQPSDSSHYHDRTGMMTFIQGGPKNRTCLSIDNSAMVSSRKTCQKFQNAVKNKRQICIVTHVNILCLIRINIRHPRNSANT